jgi:predicted Zn-dependent peptidase
MIPAMLDRKTPPTPTLAEKIEWIEATENKLENQTSLFTINAGEQDLLRLEIILPSESKDADSSSLVNAAHTLTDHGTNNKDAKAIAEAFERLGSFYQADCGPDFRGFTIFSLRSSFEKTVNVLKDVMENAAYPEKEVELWKKRSIENLRVNREKVSWLARTAFGDAIFDKSHPYGFNPTEDDYAAIDATSVRDFHQSHTNTSKCLMMLSGKLDQKEIDIVNKTFGKTQRESGTVSSSAPSPEPKSVQKIKLPKDDALQCGIRIGRAMFNRRHPDYIPFSITNAILGGYFGSRLMSNIREDKGYTYGIGSGLVPYISSGAFFISTEVGKEVCALAIDEIYKEIERLKTAPPDADELNIVKNYLLGEFQRSLDGPFALADRFKSLYLSGVGYSYLNNYLDYLNNFTAETVVEMANKYLNPNDLTEVIAG